MHTSLPKQFALFVIATTLLTGLARADFIPVALTSDSFNHDIVVEKTAPPPLMPATTASMDSGATNTGYAWYEKGYQQDSPATGLPAPGSIIASDASPDHTYALAPGYKSNNAVMIDGTFTNAVMTLATPASYSRLSFLTSAGNGPGNVQFTVHHQNGTTETATFTSPNWLSTVGVAYTAAGRVDVNAFTFDGVSQNYPTLFSRDVPLSNTNNPVTQIDFSYLSGAAHNAIFAVSGSTNQVDPFTPINVTGFNVDLIVESTAARRESLLSATTASMEGGVLESGRTWYEIGYYPLGPATGLPAPGSILTNSAAPDHRYSLATDYTVNNAIMFDSDFPTATFTPLAPAAYTSLSFLCAAGHGPVTNECVINHANGSAETNVFVIPNWFDGLPAAFISNGALNLNIRAVDSVGASNPRLYGVDIPLANAQSAVTNVTFTFKGGAVNSHAAIFAMSGFSGPNTGIRPTLSILATPGGNFQITTTQPGQLQSTTALKGMNTTWQNEGIISSTLTISPTPGVLGKFYRVVAQ